MIPMPFASELAISRASSASYAPRVSSGGGQAYLRSHLRRPLFPDLGVGQPEQGGVLQ